ncbi:hypothetical protein L228DRAFT_286271 [Xylona heveae TC161]|uniref:Peroxin/Ferlin domain-containing protein n=1 Tax=Xylona heveae (strain CBS 132557 / TC161) TaxID=1328760 RepID=A0A164ZFM7_XYLHT|nr:hypothetical protein L228DRAFT_286271 [Xylona heveae TC161]KZF19042.1 hypothetical protein L228DRAFT_286271 [Xylona heveae TC161]
MSLFGVSSRSALPPDEYDHEITLVDSTQPPEPGDITPSRTLSSNGGRDSVGRRAALRQELARRKYAKWQEERYNSPGGKKGRLSAAGSASASDTEAPGPSGTMRSTTASDMNLGLPKSSSGRTAEVDVLYENQRGVFFFGIPLYSSNSLLNLDPAAWVNASFKESAVNITNAQVPDPSWEWAWKCWYVDMSLDVDEDGWQYSFSFQPRFAWHGRHVWFHSFVRRRRWIRKRVKKHPSKLGRGRDMDRPSSAAQAHLLTPDYFTIHSPRERSPASSYNISSYDGSLRGARSIERMRREQEFEEIRDLPTLTRALKQAKVDREKHDAIIRFLKYGGEEIFYLEEKMPAIMHSFLYQTSRRQLLGSLAHIFDEAASHRDEHLKRGEPENDEEKRRIDNLMNAVKAADAEVRKLEYWSDIRSVAQQGESKGASDSSQGWGHEWTGLDSSGPATLGHLAPFDGLDDSDKVDFAHIHGEGATSEGANGDEKVEEADDEDEEKPVHEEEDKEAAEQKTDDDKAEGSHENEQEERDDGDNSGDDNDEEGEEADDEEENDDDPPESGDERAEHERQHGPHDDDVD